MYCNFYYCTVLYVIISVINCLNKLFWNNVSSGSDKTLLTYFYSFFGAVTVLFHSVYIAYSIGKWIALGLLYSAGVFDWPYCIVYVAECVLTCRQQSLFHVLAAYSVYNTEVGYCQGMSQLAALLLMYMNEEVDRFQFCSALNRTCTSSVLVLHFYIFLWAN